MKHDPTPIIERRPLRRVLLPFTVGIAFILALTGATAALSAERAGMAQPEAHAAIVD